MHGQNHIVNPIELLTLPNPEIYLAWGPLAPDTNSGCQYEACCCDDHCTCQEPLDCGCIDVDKCFCEG